MLSKQISVLIADDEKHARNRLISLLSEKSTFNVVCEVDNCDDLVKSIEKYKPDVAFLDINMPGDSVFKAIASINRRPIIVFQTAYSDYGPDAFDLNAVDYLLKPISRERFTISLNKILDRLAEGKRESISVMSGDKLNVLKISEILRVSFEDGFSFIHTECQRIYSDKTLTYYDEILSSYGFYRISRTDLVNINSIHKVVTRQNSSYSVEMDNGETLNISRRRVNGLKEILTN